MKKTLIILLCFPIFAFSQNVGFIDVGDELDEFVANSLKEWKKKGEFETTSNYNIRMRSSESKKTSLSSSFIRQKIKYLNEIDAYYCELGKYNADEEYFPIIFKYNNHRFPGERAFQQGLNKKYEYIFQINFKVNYNDAMSFKNSWNKLKNIHDLNFRSNNANHLSSLICPSHDFDKYCIESFNKYWSRFYFKISAASSNKKIYISELYFFKREVQKSFGFNWTGPYGKEKLIVPIINNKTQKVFTIDEVFENVSLDVFTYFDAIFSENISEDKEIDKFMSSFIDKYQRSLNGYNTLSKEEHMTRIEDVSVLLHKYPDLSFSFLLYRIDSYYELGIFDAAIDDLNNFFKRYNNHIKTSDFEFDDDLNNFIATHYLILGNIKYKQGKLFDAIKNFEKCSELNPTKNIYYSSKVGEVYIKMEDFSAAKKIFNKCIEETTDSKLLSDCYISLGTIQILQGKRNYCKYFKKACNYGSCDYYNKYCK